MVSLGFSNLVPHSTFIGLYAGTSFSDYPVTVASVSAAFACRPGACSVVMSCKGSRCASDCRVTFELSYYHDS
jgi:hypothetical protein